VSNYCAAVSAAIPLLVLALMIEARAPVVLARMQMQAIISAIKKDYTVVINDRWVFERFRMLLGITLWSAVVVEAIVLASIPFVPAGPPKSDLQWLLLVIGAGCALWLFALVAWVLQLLVREVLNIDAAAKMAEAEAPAKYQDDQA
jgi:hypothetical protein